MNQFRTNINNKSMEDVIIQRIKSFFRNNNLKNRNVAQLLNISETTLNNKLNGTRSLDLSTLQNIIIHFEMLSTEWLLRGDGSMYKSENATQIPSQAEENISGKSALNVLIKTIEYYQKEVERLVENIDELTRENEIMKIELERKKAAGE